MREGGCCREESEEPELTLFSRGISNAQATVIVFVKRVTRCFWGAKSEKEAFVSKFEVFFPWLFSRKKSFEGSERGQSVALRMNLFNDGVIGLSYLEKGSKLSC